MQMNGYFQIISSTPPKHWYTAIGAVLVATGLVFGVFWETWHAMMVTWQSSDTFAHGFLVLPFSLWLIWTRRAYLLPLTPSPSPIALLALIASGLLWLSAHLVHVQVVEQFALVLLLISCIWGILGNAVTRQLAFPLGFLLFMVPFGEAFVPTLMEWTANTTIWLLQLTGIPVYREGLYFTLTTGNWSVVEACSGIRYLIASFTLGLIYAYLNYTHLWKKTIFVVLSLLVPIAANGVRAYMIVMIGHLSGMQLATGVDHLIYGWLFFGLVIMLLFYAGSFWQDDVVQPPVPMPLVAAENKAINPWQLGILVSLLLSIAPWSALSHFLSARQAMSRNWDTPASVGNWAATTTQSWAWQPHFEGVAIDTLHYFTKDQHAVGLYQASFGNESQGKAELVNSQHVLVEHKDPQWRIVETSTLPLKSLDGELIVNADQFTLRSAVMDLCVLKWYRIGKWQTANDYQAKLFQLLKRFSGNIEPELLVITFVQADKNDHAPALSALQDWVSSVNAAQY